MCLKILVDFRCFLEPSYVERRSPEMHMSWAFQEDMLDSLESLSAVTEAVRDAWDFSLVEKET